MRIIPFLGFTIFTLALIIILDTSLIAPAPLGKLLSPQEGVWQNAESYDHNYNEELEFRSLQGNANVYFDERLVPHVFAEHENDAYFIQGFLHAKFRLWQMELQTLAAAGRVSEILGPAALTHDREFRRLGMLYAAENSLEAMNQNPAIKASLDAYTAGVNEYIKSLNRATIPLEYKLIGYRPELWSNLKTALFLKYMSYDLASRENDFQMTNARSYFTPSDFDLLYPVEQDSLDPIIPRGTIYNPPALQLIAPLDSSRNDSVTVSPSASPDRDNGSNNWAVSGSRTSTGAPILCNDPHLGLNLPSLWYEIQLSTPDFNAYGVSFPGAPSVIIGFNDSCAFGFTNGGRDVRDYYEIQFKDDTRKEYLFENEWKASSFRIENIKIKNKPEYLDTVVYTLFGPVMFDNRFAGKDSIFTTKNYAVRWKAHDASNELLIFNKLNRAKNYSDYNAAVTDLHTPGQNCVFAAKSGDIAIRTQGEFPAKWKYQGDFIMPGTDSTYLWKAMIPQDETPFQYNPERGFVSSANQRPTDSAYSYYLGRDYPTPRGKIINRLLSGMTNITVQDMMKLQTNNYNIFAEMARPVFLKYIQRNNLSPGAANYFSMLEQWDLNNDPASKGATVFELLWNEFKKLVYSDEFTNAPKPIMYPFESTLLEAVLRDSSYKFLDNIHTPAKESIEEITTLAMQKASADLQVAENEGKLPWAKYKDTRIRHLSRLESLSRMHLPIGGGTNVINATKSEHGPSWRMVVSLTPDTDAYGVYPGGQDGNPGSRFYDDFIDKWAAGEYYKLWMMKSSESSDKRIIGKMSFKKQGSIKS